jgi:hypothetical protein
MKLKEMNGKKKHPVPTISIHRMNENFNISENNVISGGWCQGSTYNRKNFVKVICEQELQGCYQP